MTSDYYNLRNDGYIRPAQEHESSERWRDAIPDMTWHGGNPALTPKPKPAPKPNIAHVTHRPKDAPASVCKACHDASKAIHKQGYCLECYRAYRNKIQKGNRDKRRAAANPDRVCKKCNQPAVSYSGVRLCKSHLNEYQRDLREKREATIDPIKEAHQARKKALLERKWNEKLAEYKNEE